ncbi:aminotransferase class V-fold PLP-dependent enzyme [candidate division CSSED10-310 bacterium]|uniref:Aminotransferase class V-fold PLP-dependent enzyme n=1 Tax=candidate division CSSED10-310 bacterium TaxID=2855610 RepID=A0ABV6YTC5_UNCC1
MMAIRDLFLLDSEVIFLNHGSFGACPRPVFEKYQHWQVELERQPVAFLDRQYSQLLQQARHDLGRFIGAEPDNLVYIPNATIGLNIVAHSLNLAPGDEILTTDQEYGALDRMWLFLCAKWGAHYNRQPLNLPLFSTDTVIDTIWSGVTDRTRILFLSHITSSTALILPLKELIQRARNRGIITIIDGAHAPGHIPLNLADLGADFYVGNCHKWLMAPKGAAFLYTRKSKQPLLRPLIISWGGTNRKKGISPYLDEFEFQGTRDIAAYLSVPAAIAFMRDYNWDQIRNKCHGLVRYARQEISALTGLRPLTPDSPSWFGQMAAFPLPPGDGDTLQKRLYQNFAIEIPATTIGDQQFLRLSVQGYNSQADIEALLGALKQVLPEMGASGPPNSL